jgi:hypothetical protein
MPFEMQLTQPLAETFQCGGMAQDTPTAKVMAWNALEASIGFDDVEAWKMSGVDHVHVPSAEAPGVQFVATFIRNPEHP